MDPQPIVYMEALVTNLAVRSIKDIPNGEEREVSTTTLRPIFFCLPQNESI